MQSINLKVWQSIQPENFMLMKEMRELNDLQQSVHELFLNQMTVEGLIHARFS